MIVIEEGGVFAERKERSCSSCSPCAVLGERASEKLGASREELAAACCRLLTTGRHAVSTKRLCSDLLYLFLLALSLREPWE